MDEIRHTPQHSKRQTKDHFSWKSKNSKAMTGLYNLTLTGFLVSALALPIATIDVSVKELVESVLSSMEQPLTLEQAAQMLSMVGVTLPEDTHTTYNVLQAVRSLFIESHYLAGAIVAVGSVLLPILKVTSRIRPQLPGRIWATTKLVSGRFALLDVLVIAVLVVAVSNVSGWSVTVGPAAWFYIGFALLYGLTPQERGGRGNSGQSLRWIA